MQTACVIKLHSFIKRQTNSDLTHTGLYTVWLGTQQSQQEVTDHEGERTQNQTNTNRHNSLTSRQLVILDTSWAPWQHRMNPARLRSTHTTDSRTNTLTWRWRHGGRWIIGVWTLVCTYSGNKTCHKQDGERQWQKPVSGGWDVTQAQHTQRWDGSSRSEPRVPLVGPRLPSNRGR